MINLFTLENGGINNEMDSGNFIIMMGLFMKGSLGMMLLMGKEG